MTSLPSPNVSEPTKSGFTYCIPMTCAGSSGILNGDPLRFPLPVLLAQLILFNCFSETFRLLLKPLGQHKFVSQILGGIVLGPSFLGRSENFQKRVFSQRGTLVLDVLDFVGFLFFAFVTGVQTDLTLIAKSKRLAYVMALMSFLLPLIVTSIMAFFLMGSVRMDKYLRNSLPILATLEASGTSLHVISSILMDLKLVNTELGRLSLSSSMISNLVSWFYIVVFIGSQQGLREDNNNSTLPKQMSRAFLVITIIFVFRPIMLWMMKRTPEGKPLKRSYVSAIFVMVLGCSLYGEIMGFSFLFGPLLLGLAVPDDPPLGSELVEQIECFVSLVLLPCYIINIGRKVNLFVIELNNFGIVEFLILTASFGKITGAIIPLLYCKIPFLDAFVHALILSCQGFFDIQYFDRALRFGLISEQTFSIMVIMAILHSAAFTALVKILYDPSRKYVILKRRTIQHSKRNAELGILVCIHRPENVPAIINVLEASNPTRESPMAIYVLNLVELVGRAFPLLITHRFDKHPASKSTRMDQIINAFRQYELINQSIVTVQCFTVIVPYASMHDDVCTMAIEKNTSLVIIPFQKLGSLKIKSVNRTILDKAPCSVGILVDRRIYPESLSALAFQVNFQLCVIFYGGPDDREALALGARMAERPGIRVTVLRFLPDSHANTNTMEMRFDANAFSDFRIRTSENNETVHKEEYVKEGAETAKVLHSIADDYDLILVGRRHDSESPFVLGLAEWSEFKELGVIGDVLASSDFKSRASVLVVQQQAPIVDDRYIITCIPR